MTFPLGSLRSDGASSSASAQGGAHRRDQAAAGHHGSSWRAQFGLLFTGVLWLLAVLAMTTHSVTDPAFSTSGTGAAVFNKAGIAGAWFSDLVYFVFGYSAWWLVLVAARTWLGALARVLRSDAAGAAAAPPLRHPVWLFWLGLALLLAASASLEWTRLYQWEAGVAGGNAGGVFGYTLGKASQHLLGFAGSGVLWIAAFFSSK